MPGENTTDLINGIADKMSKDVIKIMSRNVSEPASSAEPLQIGLYHHLRKTLMENGFSERYNESLDDAIYKEDIKNDYENFLAGGIRKPVDIGSTSIDKAIDSFTSNIESYITDPEGSRVKEDGTPMYPGYNNWVSQYRNYIKVSKENDSLWFDTTTHELNQLYTMMRPEQPVTKSNTYNVGLNEPAAPRMITFGDETKSPSYDMTKKGYVGHGPEGRIKAFDEFIGNLQAESGMGNPDVNAEYKHFINCFSVNGHNIDYRETGDKKLDEENLKKAKIAIVDAIANRKSVEFTKFTMDGEGKCKAETIPIAHANVAKEGKIKHEVGPADLKAAKLEQKITEKARKEAEKKHKNYLKQVKKAESDMRKRVVNGYKDRIRQAADRTEKNKIRAELREVQANYKKADREQKARQKLIDRERKDKLKLEQRQQKAYINKLSADVKQIVRQQTAEAKQRERIDNERAKQAVIDSAKKMEEAKAERDAEKAAAAEKQEATAENSARKKADGTVKEIIDQGVNKQSTSRTSASTSSQTRTQQREKK